MPDVAHALLALGFGCLIGLSLGTLGGGGSILTVPVLVYALGLPVQAATGTSLAIVGLNAAVSATDQLRRGRALPRTGLAFGASGLLGALAGAWLNHRLRGELVLILFSLLMVAAALAMLRRGRSDLRTGFEEHYDARGWVRLGAVGLGVGFLSGLFGVGGGFLIVPALVVVLGLPMQYAVGTSLLAIALNAVWGLAGHLGFGGLEWGLTGLFAAGGLVGVLAGGRMVGRLPDRSLRRAFAVLVLGVAAYTFARSAAALAI